jgi:hypothetical protein
MPASSWVESTPDSRMHNSGNNSGYPPIPIVHLVIRFLLEIAMWAGCGLAGWHVAGWAGAVAGVAGSMALWGIFGTVGDSSRKSPVVPIPGPVRLALEAMLFGIAAWGIWVVWSRAGSETFLTLTLLHYAITWERQWWLIRGAPMPEVG